MGLSNVLILAATTTLEIIYAIEHSLEILLSRLHLQHVLQSIFVIWKVMLGQTLLHSFSVEGGLGILPTFINEKNHDVTIIMTYLKV